ncbi:MAG: glycoside hydrolase family 27 protein [Lachnospiraceae bacterium]|nr:glycoside hydrolase family 27 protein [Lachnospiraceae bacterium]
MLNLKNAPRGWNSWDCYGAAVTEDTVRKNAEYMAENMKEAGYEYVVVDIQWYEPGSVNNEYHPFADVCMDEYGRLMPAENRFPSAAGGAGFKPLADYVHSLGLKFGIHIMRGIPRQAVTRNLPVYGTEGIRARDIAKTASICAWNTDNYGVDPTKKGARQYYDSIFALYASWDVDFVKCDDICRELPHEEEELVMLSEALRGCGRDMVLSLSPGPALLEKSELYKAVSNMWRITDDFWDDWKLLYAMFERAEKWSIHTGHNHYPDADMLPVGAIRQVYDPDYTTAFTIPEQETMMVLWCIMRSPLMAGGELTKNDNNTLALLTNPGLMEMHACSRHAHQVFRKKIGDNEVILWTAMKASDKGGYDGQYVAVFNSDGPDAEIAVDLSELELTGPVSGEDIMSRFECNFDKEIKVRIQSHGARAFCIRSVF